MMVLIKAKGMRKVCDQFSICFMTFESALCWWLGMLSLAVRRVFLVRDLRGPDSEV